MGGPEVAVEGGRWPPATSPFAPSVEAQADSISLFEMPASRAARRARMALVLVLDAILAGAGVVMLMAYFDSRGDARVDPAVHGGGPASVDQAPGSAPAASAPPDGGASLAPRRPDAKARPASTPAPGRRKPAPKQKSRPAPKSQPVILDDGSRVDA